MHMDVHGLEIQGNQALPVDVPGHGLGDEVWENCPSAQRIMLNG